MSTGHSTNGERQAFRSHFATWLSQQRTAFRLTQREVADAIGVSLAAVFKWERGEHDISAYNASKLRSYFKRRRAGQATHAAST